MSNVDNRIVNMKFDNAQFEKNISQTLGSLDKLEKKLEFKTGTRNIQKIEGVSNKFSLSGLQHAVETISKRFSTLGIIGTQALRRLTDEAITLGNKLYTNVTEPLFAGGKNRALNIQQAEFQIKGLLGKKEFKKQWSEIQEDINYAVRDTAYGFDEAAKAASQFMASGIKPGKELRMSLRAISGVAGMTGRSYEEISRIFTGAAGNGRIFATELNSIGERGLNAAAVLAEKLKKTEAQIRDMTSHGEIDFRTFAQAMDEAYGPHAKKANEVYTGSLANIKAALARIGAEIKGPELLRYRDLFNSLIPIIDNVHEGLMPVINSFNEWSNKGMKNIIKQLDKFGRKVDQNGNKIPKKAGKELIKNVKNISKGLNNIFKFANSLLVPIKKAFRDIFPKKTVKDVTVLTKNFKELTLRLRLSSKNSENFRKIFRGLFSVINAGIKIIKVIINQLKSIRTNSKGLASRLLELGGRFGDFLTKLSGSRLNKVLDSFSKGFDNARSSVGRFTDKIKKTFDTFSSNKVFQSIRNLDLMSKIAYVTGKALNFIGDTVIKTISLLADLSKQGIEHIKTFFNSLFYAVKNQDGDQFQEIINNILGGTILVSLKWLIEQLTSFVRAAKPITKTFGEALDSIRSAAFRFGQKAKYEAFYAVAKSVALITLALLVLSGMNRKKLMTSVTVIGLLLAELTTSVKSLDSTFKKSKFFGGVNSASRAIVLLSISALILASSLRVLKDLDPNQLASGVAAITGLITVLVIAMKTLTTKVEKRAKFIVLGSELLIKMSIAINILARSVKYLSQLSWEELAKGISGVSALMGIIVGFAHLIDRLPDKKMAKIGLDIIAISVAFKIMASAAKDFASISWEDLGKAGSAIVGLILAISLMSKLTSNVLNDKQLSKTEKSYKKSKNSMLQIGASLLLISVAFKIMASAAKDIATMSWEDLAKAGSVVAGILLAIVLVSKLTEKSIRYEKISRSEKSYKKIKNSMLQIGASLLLISVAFKIMASAAKDIAKLSLIDLAKPLLSMIAVFAAIKYFIQDLNTLNFLKLSGGLALVSISLGMLSASIMVMSLISWGRIIKSMIVLAGTFYILSKAAKMTEKSIKPIFAFTGAMALLGVAFAAIGAGVFLLSVGLAGLAGSVGVVGKVIYEICLGLVRIVPDLLAAAGEGFYRLLKTFLGHLPELMDMWQDVIVASLKLIADSAPDIAKAFHSLIVSVIPMLTKDIPLLAEALIEMWIKIIDVLIRRAPEIVAKVAQLIKAIVSSIIDVVGDINPASFAAAIAAFAALASIFFILAKMKDYAKDAAIVGALMIVIFGAFTGMFLLLNIIDTPKLLTIAGDLVAILGVLSVAMLVCSNIPVAGAAKAVAVLAIAMGGITAIIAALGAIKQIQGVDWLISEGAAFMKQIGSAIGGFIGSVVGSFVEGMADHLIAIADDLSAFMEHLGPFIKGSNKISSSSMDSVLRLAAVILALTASSLIDQIADFLSTFTGKKKSFADFGKELADLGPYISKFGDQVSGLDVKAVEGAARAGEMLASLSNSLGREGGLLQGIIGEKVKLGDFGKELADFGPHLVNFAKETKSITGNSVKGAVQAGKMLSGLNAEMPARGGLLQGIMGEQISLSTFGEEIEGFMPHLKEASRSAIGIRSSAVDGAVTAGKMLAGLNKELPARDGALQWLVGQTISLDTFGKEVSGFIKNMANGLQDIPDIEPNATDKVVTVAKSVAKLDGILGKEGGFITNISKFFNGGKVELPKIGTQIGEFLKNMYYEMYIGGLWKDSATKSAENSTLIAGMAKSIMDLYSTFTSVDLKESHVTDMYEPMKNIIELLDNLAQSKVKDADLAKVKKTINSVFEITGDIGENMSNYRRKFTDEVGWYIDYGTSKFGGGKENQSVFNMYAKSIVTSWIRGFEEKEESFKKEADWYKDKLKSVVKADKEKLKAYGSRYPQYIIDGLSLDSKHLKFEKALNYYKNKIKDFASDKAGSWGEKIRAKYKKLGSSIISNLTKGINNTALVDKNGKLKKNSPVRALTSIFDSIAKIGKYSKEGDNNAIYTFVKDLIDEFIKINAAAGNIDYSSLNDWRDWMVGLVKDLVGEFGSDKNRTSFSDSLKWWSDELDTFKETQKTALSGLGQDVVDSLRTGFEDANNETSFLDALDNISNKITNLGDSTDETTTLQNTLTDRGKKILKWLSDGFTSEGSKKAKKKISGVLHSVLGPIVKFGNYDKNGNKKPDDQTIGKVLKKRAESIMTALGEAFNDEVKIQQLQEDVCQAFSGIDGKFTRDKAWEQGKNIGRYILEGICEGLSSPSDGTEKKDPHAATRKVASDIIGTLRKDLEINSPSKAMFRIGRYVVVGLANGINQFAYLAGSAAQLITSETKDGLNPLGKEFNNLIPDSLNLNPTITPVLDLSNIQNGSDRMSSLFGPVGVGVYGTSAIASRTAALGGAYGLTAVGFDDTALLNKIQSLQDELVTMADNIQNLQIVMDTGATVGALASGMDNALGRIASRKERGI